jgi:hypothetical protein
MSDHRQDFFLRLNVDDIPPLTDRVIIQYAEPLLWLMRKSPAHHCRILAVLFNHFAALEMERSKQHL